MSIVTFYFVEKFTVYAHARISSVRYSLLDYFKCQSKLKIIFFAKGVRIYLLVVLLIEISLFNCKLQVPPDCTRSERNKCAGKMHEY